MKNKKSLESLKGQKFGSLQQSQKNDIKGGIDTHTEITIEITIGFISETEDITIIINF